MFDFNDAWKDLNSELTKPESMSNIVCSGQPCVSKIECSTQIVAFLEVDGTIQTSTHLVYKSLLILGSTC